MKTNYFLRTIIEVVFSRICGRIIYELKKVFYDFTPSIIINKIHKNYKTPIFKRILKEFKISKNHYQNFSNSKRL